MERLRVGSIPLPPRVLSPSPSSTDSQVVCDSSCGRYGLTAGARMRQSVLVCPQRPIATASRSSREGEAVAVGRRASITGTEDMERLAACASRASVVESRPPFGESSDARPIRPAMSNCTRWWVAAFTIADRTVQSPDRSVRDGRSGCSRSPIPPSWTPRSRTFRNADPGVHDRTMRAAARRSSKDGLARGR